MKEAPEAGSGSFVEVPLPEPVGASVLGSGELELSLPGGVVLRWKP